MIKTGLAAAFLALSLVAPLVTAMPGRRAAETVALVFPPWFKAPDVMNSLANADAGLVRFGRFPFFVIVRPAVGSTPPAFRATGAWLVLDAAGVAGCLI